MSFYKVHRLSEKCRFCCNSVCFNDFRKKVSLVANNLEVAMYMYLLRFVSFSFVTLLILIPGIFGAFAK